MPSIAVYLAIGAVSLVLWRLATARRLKLPPTPKGLPLLGNLLQMPTRLPWETYMAWSKEVDSDVVHINLAGTHLIVLNSEEAISDLFDKRAAIYTGRPQISMIELTGWANCFALADDGDTWKHQRRILHSEFSQSAVGRYRPQVTKTARALLFRLLEKPDNFTEHFTHLAGSLITLTNYGIDVKDEGDPFIEAALEGFVVATQSANLGKFFVNALPFLKHVPGWVPGAGFQKTILEFREKTNKMLDSPYDKCKEDMNNTGASHDSFVRNSIERIDNKTSVATQEQNIKWAAVGMLLGGIDTTSNTMGFFVYAMAKHPEIQKKAQAELDRVVGAGTLPDFNDEAQLPYITAIVREVLRWEPVGPTGIPHLVAKDDEYRGWDIPKGSYVIGNLWSILHNEKLYPQPDKFIPDRFIKDGRLNPDVPDPMLNGGVFGAGRRVCPGRYLAVTTLWVAMASILSTFDIEKAVDDAGNVIEPEMKINPDLPTLQALLPFKCSIKPRNKQSEDLIRSSALNAA